jgi:long-chain acyl-CoA synthetase
VGVPTILSALLEHPRLAGARAAFRSLRVCISGAAPLLTETKKRLEALTGGHIVEGYSLTEGLIASALTPAKGGSPEGSVGLPLPDVEMRIVDAEEGVRELPPGEVGGVLIRAPQLMPGYWRDRSVFASSESRPGFSI